MMIERLAIAALLMLAVPAWAQAPGAEEAGQKTDGPPAVVKTFEAGQKSKDGQKTKTGQKSKTGQKTKAGQKTEDGQKTKARKETVKLTFTVAPRVKARVYHGKKLLGTTPFTVDWRRDSGPVDVVVRAHGYLPVNTRAYTFRDDNVDVKLTRPDDARSLLGYKAPVEPPPEDEGEEGDEGEEEGETTAPDGAQPAAPAPAPAAPASPTAPATP